MRVSTLAAALCLASTCAAAQTVAPPSPVQPPPAHPADAAAAAPTACCALPVGSVILLELVDTLSSKTQKIGDRFKIRVAEPVSIGDTVVLSIDDEGMGEVIDAARPGLGGRGGKLVLAARYIDHRGIRVPLRAFKLGGAGRGRAIESLAVSEAVGFIGLAVQGDQIELPAGTRATAKIAAVVDLSPAAAIASTAPSLPPTNR